MRDPAQHCEFRLLVQSEPLPHPRKEMRQAEMPPFDTLWYSRAARGEAEGSWRVGAQHNAGWNPGRLLKWLQDVWLTGSGTGHAGLRQSDGGDV